jgi:hypothetical protein
MFFLAAAARFAVAPLYQPYSSKRIGGYPYTRTTASGPKRFPLKIKDTNPSGDRLRCLYGNIMISQNSRNSMQAMVLGNVNIVS